MVKNRMEYLGIKDYYAKSSHKISDYEDFKSRYNLKDSEILMMGDDIPDIGIMNLAEISACPANAVPEVKAISDYISPVFGGKGAVRDVIVKLEDVLPGEREIILQGCLINFYRSEAKA